MWDITHWVIRVLGEIIFFDWSGHTFHGENRISYLTPGPLLPGAETWKWCCHACATKWESDMEHFVCGLVSLTIPKTAMAR